jgi:hypothetical protein
MCCRTYRTKYGTYFFAWPEPATLNSLEEPPETAAVAAAGRDSGAEMLTSRDSGAEPGTSEASGTEPVTSRDPRAEPKASLESGTEAQVSTTTFATAEMDASPVAGTSRASNIRDPVTPDSTSQVSLKNICWLNC